MFSVAFNHCLPFLGSLPRELGTSRVYTQSNTYAAHVNVQGKAARMIFLVFAELK